MNHNKKKQKTNRLILLIITLMLSFGFNNQGLAQNVPVNQPNSDKIKISADNPPVPSYLKHSKKAKQLAQKQQKKQKKNNLQEMAIKVLKALVLAIALFLGLVAIFIKNKDKFTGQSQTPISLAKAMKQEEQKTVTTQKPHKQSENLNPNNKIRDLVFDFFNMNK